MKIFSDNERYMERFVSGVLSMALSSRFPEFKQKKIIEMSISYNKNSTFDYDVVCDIGRFVGSGELTVNQLGEIDVNLIAPYFDRFIYGDN